METKLSKCKPTVSKGKSKFPSVQEGFRYDDEEGNKGFVYTGGPRIFREGSEGPEGS